MNTRLKQFGKIDTTFNIDFKNTYWKCKFGEDGVDSNILIKLVYNKRKYKLIENLPKYIDLNITIVKGKREK